MLLNSSVVRTYPTLFVKLSVPGYRGDGELLPSGGGDGSAGWLVGLPLLTTQFDTI